MHQKGVYTYLFPDLMGLRPIQEATKAIGRIREIWPNRE